jgi:hypothetical protein
MKAPPVVNDFDSVTISNFAAKPIAK